MYSIRHEVSTQFSLYLSQAFVKHMSTSRDRILFAYSFICPLIQQTFTSIFNIVITITGTDAKISLKMSTRCLKATTYVTKIQKEKCDQLLKKHEKAIQGRKKRITSAWRGKEGWRVSSRQYHGGGSTSMES